MVRGIKATTDPDKKVRVRYKVERSGSTVRVKDGLKSREYTFSDPYTATIFARMIK